MKWQNWVADYLTFTRRERIGLLALVLLILIIFLLPAVVGNKAGKGHVLTDTSWIAAAKKLEIKEVDNNEQGSPSPSHDDNDNAYRFDRSVDITTPAPVLFDFDPNTIDGDGWKRLGIKEKTIHTIQNYLNKGGHFYKPEDLQKIYGLHADDYSRLAPHIKIQNNRVDNKFEEYVKKDNEPNRNAYSAIDINTADTTSFISLPGIGSKLATRIINFRDKLGGFYSVAQIGEVYGLPDSVFQKIKQYLELKNVSVKQININTATVDELKAHPYIRYNLANPIIAYRNEHGPFLRVDDIKKVMPVTEDIYKKICPYLSL